MKEKTTSKISQRLMRYGALTTVIAGASEASGQIIYTDVDPDEGGSGVVYNLDLDNNLNRDFVIRHFNQPSAEGNLDFLVVGPTINAQGMVNNSILAFSSDGFAYPFALNEGEVISAGKAGWNNELMQSMNEKSCLYENDNWCDVDDKYLGLRFKIDGSYHYGWARLRVGDSGSDWLIKDYAYNTNADAPIDAGETSPMSLADVFKSSVQVISKNRNISILNLQGDASFKLYAMTGQSVIQGAISQSSYTINAGNLSSGMYVVELKDMASGANVRRKVML
ncbi:Por secretion system C-terminal sorting domain-containing protein [Pustulibacterium marinum]|uniref:Por secretion system C-terminal sorting domain-containing protein n=1 Tax=Pustulibacterium marinum TaxID=1224947 RepID=A0A1I7F0B0_9FLAO|nr:T9SS type A sorting domain-containing protein [Pustulibacterium marinum]SFU29574.1 Por secretion system C-terminal sorting domain-containing protein [Pustulibacterium marinum]